MAYPTIDAPYGLVPVKLLSGVPFVGTTRQYSIASGYGTNIFYGDAVKLVTGGTVERDTFDAAMTPIGVFLGCTFTDPNSEQVTFKQYFPASTAASDCETGPSGPPNTTNSANLICISVNLFGNPIVDNLR